MAGVSLPAEGGSVTVTPSYTLHALPHLPKPFEAGDLTSFHRLGSRGAERLRSSVSS